MSVINQVLLELEKRRATGAERGTIPDHVRALPEGGDDHRAWWIAGASVGGIVLAGTIWAATGGYGWIRQPSIAAPTGTDVAIERVVAASAEADGRPRAGAPRGREAEPRVMTRMSLELASPPETHSATSASAEPARPPAPIPAERVLARVNVADSAGVQDAAPPAVATKEPAKPAAPAQPTSKPPAVAEKSAAGVPAKTEIEKQLRQPGARELADSEYRKAANLLQQGRLSEALEGFRATLALQPTHHGARQAMVALLLNAKSHAEAERMLQEGLKLAPDQIGFAMTLARLQVDRADNAGAIATLQGAAGHAQANPDYLAFLAALLQRQGRHEEAIEHFGAALRIKPSAGVWWLGLGISLQAASRAADAHEAYRRAKAGNLTCGSGCIR